MAKLPYFFETPVPKYFKENGWFESEHMFKYVTWAFSRCQTIPHKIFIEGKEITLEPFEFISGRLSSPKECFLTENIFRNQQKILLNAHLLKKTTNSLTNHFTCYIWSTERFSRINNQQNNQPLTNHQPTINHKQRTKTEDLRPLLKEKQEKENVVVPVVVPFLKEKAKEDLAGLFSHSEFMGYDITMQFFEKWVEKKGFDYVNSNYQLMLKVPEFKSSAGAWLNTALKENYAGKSELIELNKKFAEEFKKKYDYKSLKINKTCATDKETGDDYQFNITHEAFKLALTNKFKARYA
jgi:hypothetical protein